MSKVFFDTNVILYCYDDTDKTKRDICRKLIQKGEDEGNGVISTQVMQEFYSIATRKFGMDPFLAKGILEAFERFEIVTVTPNLISAAADCQVLSRISFWDALIVVTAEMARCDSIYSEDFNTGQKIRGIRIQSPFPFQSAR